MSYSNYRPEIDGQRALAVIAVILYHAKINIDGNILFTGGFIGVDIFFVISGYLITSIILNDLKNNNFSLINFFERRARRLLPVLLLVILFFLPLAWMYYFPSDLKHFSKLARASILFFSNFAIWESGFAYAAKSSLLEPFLHTWSLSVEEQFYIVMPVILLFMFKYLRGQILLIFILGFTFSLILAEYGSRYHPAFNFYMLPTRGWELLAGSILAKLEIDYGRNNRRILTNTMPMLGLILIISSFIFFDEQTRHPSSITLVPVLGIMLIIWFSKPNEALTMILSSKVFVGIGLISYSLYMWHYPIFAFARYLHLVNGTLLNYVLIFSLIFSLSIFSYFLIEKPFRDKSLVPFKKFIITIVTFSSLLITINSIIFLNKEGWFPNRFDTIFSENFVEPWSVVKQNDVICYDRIINNCVFNTKGTSSLLMVGDSQLSTLSKSILKMSLKNNYKLTLLNFTECLYIPNFDQYATNAIRKRICNSNLQKNRTDQIKNDQNSIVIIGGQFPVYLSGKHFITADDIGVNEESKWPNKIVHSDLDINMKWQDGFINGIYDLLEYDINVVLIYPIPELGWNPNRKFMYSDFGAFRKKIDYNKSLTISFDTYIKRSKESFQLLDSIEHPNLYKIYPHELFCNKELNNECMTHENNRLLYFDDDHLSLYGSIRLTELIEKKVKLITENVSRQKN
tara:strand:+ start:2151 stop:4202 length:2052 start_codon:yes stop_codon:yes gene_type:complete